MEIIIFFASFVYLFTIWFAYNLYSVILLSWKGYRRGLTRIVMGFVFVVSFLLTGLLVTAPIHLFLSTILFH